MILFANNEKKNKEKVIVLGENMINKKELLDFAHIGRYKTGG